MCRMLGLQQPSGTGHLGICRAGWLTGWHACMQSAVHSAVRMLGGRWARVRCSLSACVCKINCAVQYSVHGEVPSCDEA